MWPRITAHVQHVIRYADKRVQVTPDMIEVAHGDAEVHVIDKFVNWHFKNGKSCLRVRWWDYDADDDTDQLFEELIVDAPKKTLAYLKSVKHFDPRLQQMYHDLSKGERKGKRKKNKQGNELDVLSHGGQCVGSTGVRECGFTRPGSRPGPAKLWQ